MDIDKQLCYGCGIVDDATVGMGILAMINRHSCPANTYTYNPSRFKIADLNFLFGGKHSLDLFKDLIKPSELTHFRPIKVDIHPLDKMLYSHAREYEVKYMKRMRDYIEKEEQFFYSY